MNTEKIEVCFVCSKQLYVRCTDCNIIYCSSECQSSNSNTHNHHHAKKDKKVTKPQPKPVALQVMESRLPENVIKGIKGESKNERLRRAVEKEPSKFGQESMAASSSTLNTAKESCKDMVKKNEKINFETDKECNGNLTSSINQATTAVENLQIDPQPTKVPKITPLVKNLPVPKPIIQRFEIPPTILGSDLDNQGYFKVIVTHMDLPNKQLAVILEKKKLATMSNQMIMNTDYESNGIPFINIYALKNYSSLIMAFVSDNWLRCRVLMGDEIYLKDVDSGNEYNLTLGNFPLKYPLDRETMVPAFAYNIQLINVPDLAVINIGDVLRIRMINPNYRGISLTSISIDKSVPAVPKNEPIDHAVAVPPVKDEPITSTSQPIAKEQAEAPTTSPISPVLKKEKVEASSEAPKLTMKNTKTKILPSGYQHLMLVDGTNFTKGKIFVVPAEDSLEFYTFLEDQITMYISACDDGNNYRPKIGELALIKYTDGEFLRGLCTGTMDNDYDFFLLDFGNYLITKPENIWSMPQEIAEIPIITRKGDVKLKSGNSLESVDAQKTVEKLFNMFEGFQAKVDLIAKGKYTITIDDSLVIFMD